MKRMVLVFAGAMVLLLAGCETERHHRGGGWGDRDDYYEHGRGYSNPDYRSAPYQGYPNYNNYPRHY